MYNVPDDLTKLRVLTTSADDLILRVVRALRDDQVALVKEIPPGEADAIIGEVARQFGLLERLELQAAFASVHKHRSRVGKYFMTVNARNAYEFIPSHSEGNSFANMQIASFYCHENTTDGGYTVLQNTSHDGAGWNSMREVVTKVDLGSRRLNATELAQLRMVHGIRLPESVLNADDEILSERESPLPGVKCFSVLTRLTQAYSEILQTSVNVYWDTVASTDNDSSEQYVRLLQSCNLLRERPSGGPARDLDNTRPRKVWQSGVAYEDLFTSKLVIKLSTGDLLVQNNLTWTHSSSNWTPNSGNRQLSAAFA